MEEKQKERLRKAREEKERINEMLGRGIPKSKPLSAAQIADQEFKKQRVLEEKQKKIDQQKLLEQK